MTVIGSVFLSIGAWLLELSGALFNWVVDSTVVLFSSRYDLLFKDGVEAGWVVFRNLANILIIGMFVFIAISIILGLKEYGQKKLVARVLIVAVLINFSLLFTELIIDFSNFTATQFYKAASAGSLPNGQETATLDLSSPNAPANYNNPGIAGRFLSFSRTGTGLDAGAALLSESDKTQSGWLALVHGLLAGTLFATAALVLLYGSFLLLSRALLLVFLLLTSALAFASYLIPKFAEKGWSLWWDSLIKSAALAPLMMIFLWASLQIAERLPQAGSLGDLATDASKGGNLSAFFSYFIVIGLLFISFKVASMFSGSITGFNIASATAVAPFTMGARALSVPLRSRFGLGGYFARREERKGKAIKTEQTNFSAISNQLNALKRKGKEKTDEYAAKERELRESQQKLSRLASQKSFAGKRAKGKFNLADAKPVQAAVSGLGIKGFATGQSDKDAKSYAEKAETRAKAAIGKAAAIAEVPEEAIRESVRSREVRERENARTRMREERKVAEEQKQAAEESMRGQRELLQTQKKAAAEYAQQEEEKLASLGRGHDANLDEIMKRYAAEADENKKKDIMREHDTAAANKKREIDAQSEKIKEARDKITGLDQELEKVERPAKVLAEQLQNLDEELAKINDDRTFEASVKKVEDRAVAEARSALSQAAGEAAATYAHKRLTNLPLRMLGEEKEKDYIARLARTKMGKEVKQTRIKEQLTAQASLAKDIGVATPAGGSSEGAKGGGETKK